MASLRFSIAGSMREIDPEEWNALAEPAGNPFLSWGFLALLEDSGALERSSWRPVHALVRRGRELVACAPFYLADTSAGQFTWDDGMEGAALACGSRWFPKLVGMVPFTPAPVWRVLSSTQGVAGSPEGGRSPRLGGADAQVSPAAFLLSSVEALARRGGLSGLHLQWVDAAFGPAQEGTEPGSWLAWRRQAYRWENRAYADFPAFLAAFSKNMRRNVLRDRAAVSAAGLVTRMVPGTEAPPHYWELMGSYYRRTNGKFGPWAARFLPDEFFSLAPGYIALDSWFSAAFRQADGPGADPVALALLLRGRDGLWGRYWGASSDEDGLHFETCYYRPIEFAIENRLSFFDPGMGGHHKARRGFRSSTVASYHRVFEADLSTVFASAIAKASAEEEAFAAELNRELPFKAGGGSPSS